MLAMTLRAKSRGSSFVLLFAGGRYVTSNVVHGWNAKDKIFPQVVPKLLSTFIGIGPDKPKIDDINNRNKCQMSVKSVKNIG